MSASQPRVTFVIDDLGHGGAQRQLHLTLRALRGAGVFAVVVLSDVTEPYASRIRSLGITVEAVPRRAGADAARAIVLSRVLKQLDTQIAHAMLESSDAYTFLAASMLRIPYVLSMRSDRVHTAGPRAPVLAWMMRRAPAMTVNSEKGREHLVRRVGVRAERVTLVPNIVEVPSPARDSSAAGNVIGAVGRLVEMKRFDILLDTLPSVRRTVPDARIVLVGDGPSRHGLENLARRDGMDGAVEFVGAVDDAGPHIATFACLAVTSAHEGLPNAALEALARGVPVATVAAGDLPRVVTDGVTGVIARDASPEAMSDAIVRALTSPDLRASAALEGPRLMRERHSAEHTRRELLALYSRLSG
jgi:glycosyltransferase involved in cell wall biosynthesis